MPTCRVCHREAEPAQIIPGQTPTVDPLLQDNWICTGCRKLTTDCTCAPAW